MSARDADGNHVEPYTWVSVVGHEDEFEVMSTRHEGVAIIRNAILERQHTSTVPAATLRRHPRLWQAYLIPPRGSRTQWALRVNGVETLVNGLIRSADVLPLAAAHLTTHYGVTVTEWQYRPSSDTHCVHRRLHGDVPAEVAS